MEIVGAVLNDSLIRTKALEIAKKHEISDFKASSGWSDKFKKRHQLKLRKLHGESFDIKEANFDEYLINLKGKIKEYGEENVYNADETGLFYKLIPSKTICKNVRKGYKLLKERLSVLLCANMTGEIKRKPLVIGKFLIPVVLEIFLHRNMLNMPIRIKLG